MASLEELRAERIKKLKLLALKGMEAYPIETSRTHSIADAVTTFNKISKGKKQVVLAGRVYSIRGQGGIAFVSLGDGTERMQALFKKDDMNAEEFSLFRDTVDIGDFIEVKGPLGLSKTNEKSLFVRKWKMLTKSLRPLPNEWHGLADVEERYRRRYLDLISNPEVRGRFVTRSKVVSEIRATLSSAGYMEVETSVLQPLAGGASAEPFKTHHNALDIDLYLRIAPELDLKKLLVGGFEKVFEISRNFRNEGIDVTHNPEFTTVEWYAAYTDAKSQAKFTEELIRRTVKAVSGKTKVKQGDTMIDFGKKFTTVRYEDLLVQAGIKNPMNASRESLVARAEKSGISVAPGDSREKIMDMIYKKSCRPHLVNPTIITEYPVAMLPLAKRINQTSDLVSAFQVVAGGVELVKAFSELNDPLDQRSRFAAEESNRERGDKEAQPADEAFLEALEYGMPPAGGVGLSIDRLTMLLTDTQNIREVIFFPTLRPKQ